MEKLKGMNFQLVYDAAIDYCSGMSMIILIGRTVHRKRELTIVGRHPDNLLNHRDMMVNQHVMAGSKEKKFSLSNYDYVKLLANAHSECIYFEGD